MEYPHSPYFVVFHEVDKRRPLDLHGLPLSVVERQDEVEEIGLPQVGGRLLFEMGSRESHTAVGMGHREKESERLNATLTLRLGWGSAIRGPFYT